MRAAVFLISGFILAGCAGGAGHGTTDPADPLEPVNRQVHAFNTGLDARVIKPLSGAIRAGRGRDGAEGQPGAMTLLSNFGSNLSQPGKALNFVMQGRPEPAVKTTFRFLVNSTFGLLGMFDPASADFALPEQDTDFGETLHVWGVGEGPYLVLPVLGPSNLRDATGKVVDMAIDPLGQVLTPAERRLGFGARMLSKAGDRGRFGSTVDQVLHESADGYAQMRLIYRQHRRYELKQEEDAIDPYAD